MRVSFFESAFYKTLSRSTVLVAMAASITLATLWIGFMFVGANQRQTTLDQAGSKLASVAAGAAFHAATLIASGQPLALGEQKIAPWVRLQNGKLEEYPSFLRALRSQPGTHVVLHALSGEEKRIAANRITRGTLPPIYRIEDGKLIAQVSSLDTRIRAFATQSVDDALVPWRRVTRNIAITLFLLSALILTLSVLLIRQLTHREATEKALRAATELALAAKEQADIAKNQADAANRAKSEFLANMSHELRTPLNAIIGFSEIMKDEVLGPVGSLRYKAYSADIFDSGSHLLSLINDVLDMSKFDTGLLELQEENVAVAPMVQNCAELMQTQAAKAGVRLSVDVEEGLPTLWADNRRIKQILFNLLSNAVKFTEQGGEVRMRAFRNADGLVLRVSDTGIGMTADEIPKALERFRQIDSAMNRKYTGTGLGLPLVQHLTDLHGGRLEITSEPGVGTVVTVTLPASRLAVHADTVAA